MAALGVALQCTAGGTTEITLNFECKRSGSNNDNAAFRIVRRGGAGEIALPSEPQFVLPGDRDIRSWRFIDLNVPLSVEYTYILQIRRIDGGGTFFNMLMTAIHYRK